MADNRVTFPSTGPVDRPERPNSWVTAWFPEHLKPVRTGLYQVWQEPSMYAVGASPEILWCWFDAERQAWGWAYSTRRDAMARQWRNPQGATQSRVWRGATEAALGAMQQGESSGR